MQKAKVQSSSGVAPSSRAAPIIPSPPSPPPHLRRVAPQCCAVQRCRAIKECCHRVVDTDNWGDNGRSGPLIGAC